MKLICSRLIGVRLGYRLLAAGLCYWLGVSILFMNPPASAQSGTASVGPWASKGFVTHRFESSDGVTLRYHEKSPASKPVAASGNEQRSHPTLIFVPGWAMPGWIWADMANRFADQYRVLVFDPRGQGASDIAATGYNYPRRSLDIAEMIQASQAQSPVLIGWSLGGLESLQFLHHHHAKLSAQQKIRGLVLVDHSVGVGKPPVWDPTFFSRLRADQAKAMAGFVRGMYQSSPSPAYLADLTQAALKLPLEPSLQLLSQPVPREFWRDTIVNADIPIAYYVIPKFAEQAQIIKELKPGLTIQVFPQAGHALFVDAPKAFETALRNFFSSAYLSLPPSR